MSKKKIICILLCLIVAFSAFSTAVSAADSDTAAATTEAATTEAATTEAVTTEAATTEAATTEEIKTETDGAPVESAEVIGESEDADAPDGDEPVANDNTEDADFSEKDGVYIITIPNQSGYELPATGGIGTTIFYVVGIVLVLGAAAIIIARRKAEQE